MNKRKINLQNKDKFLWGKFVQAISKFEIENKQK